MIILDDKKPLLFVGDIHGDWNELIYILKTEQLNNCNLICVGDCGIGFQKQDKQKRQIQYLNEEFNSIGVNFLSIRGNHDDPSYFNGDFDLENFKLLKDYSICKYKDKVIQLIGGAVSIDRTGRKEGISYWVDETIKFDKEACVKADILITHTSPSFCYPSQLNEMVYGWAREDAYLLEDLSDERAMLNELFKECSPSLHLFGHFHSSHTEFIGNCKHKLLDIFEIWEYNENENCFTT